MSTQPLTEEGTREDTGAPVLVELDDAQVNVVLRAASNGGHLAQRLAALAGSPFALGEWDPDLDKRRVSRSLLLGLLTYAAFPVDGGDLGVNELAKQLGVGVSTTHRYLKTLVVAGLLERNSTTRRYRLAGGGGHSS